MNADFDNMRRNIAKSYNLLVGSLNNDWQRDLAVDLCNELAGLVALECPIEDGFLFVDLSEEVTLADPFGEEEP